MSVTIRLAKFGRKHAPSYKIVVANTRDKRNGRFLDVLGHFNPSTNPTSFDIDKTKYEDWKNKGALTTKAVEKLVAGTYEYVKYDPNKKDEEPEAAKAEEAKTEEATETETKEESEESSE